jgi:hypothetical protein
LFFCASSPPTHIKKIKMDLSPTKPSPLSKTLQTLVLQHIEQDPLNCQLKVLLQDKTLQHLLPGTVNRALSQYRTRKLARRNSSDPYQQQIYVAGCVDHEIAINRRYQDLHLQAIEEKLQKQKQLTPQKMSTPIKSEDQYNLMLDARKSHKSTMSGHGSTPSNDTRKPMSAIKMTASKAGTAIICDLKGTEVDVDLIVDADTSNPWATLNGSLFTLVPNITVGEKKSGKGVWAMSAFELLTHCPDPRDAELRTCHLANGGYGWVMTYEILTRSLMKDPDALTDVLVDVADEGGRKHKEYVTRCQSTETEYRAMFTRLSQEKIKTAKVLIMTNQKCNLEHLNTPNDNGKLQMLASLQKRTLKLEGTKLVMPVLTLVWRAALVDSIATVEKPKPTVEQLSKKLSATWISAPEREDEDSEDSE